MSIASSISSSGIAPPMRSVFHPDASDVGHHRGVVGIAGQPLVGLVTVGAGLHADAVAAHEREDLALALRADLGDGVAVPRLVLPGAGLGEAVGDAGRRGVTTTTVATIPL